MKKEPAHVTSQTLQTALWSCYLPYGDDETVERVLSPNKPIPTDTAVEILQRNAEFVEPYVLRLALWNLVRTYERRAHPPAAFYELLDSNLELGVREAQRLAATQDLPPDPDGRIRHPAWRAEDDGRVVQGELVFDIDRPLEEMERLLNPAEWWKPRTPAVEEQLGVWRSVSRQRARGRSRSSTGKFTARSRPPGLPPTAAGTFSAQANLPGGSGARKPLSFVFNADATFGPRVRQIDYESTGSSPSADSDLRFNAYIKLEKVEGRPGATRVKAWRRVRFPDDQPFRIFTLAFWTQTEVLTAALPEARGTTLPRKRTPRTRRPSNGTSRPSGTKTRRRKTRRKR